MPSPCLRPTAFAAAASLSIATVLAAPMPGKAGTGKGAAQPRTLDPIEVTTDPVPRYQERWSIDIEDILRLPRGNGDLASLLRLNPHVQIDDNARSQRTPGEIRPAEIVINGAPYYQNRVQIDGVSFTNDLDPASNNPNHYADPPSATQGLALDTSLVGRIDVYDSNIPARFGGFNGGVIDARTRRAREGLQGRLAFRHTRDSWVADDLVDPAERSSFEQSTSAARQLQFEKSEVRLMLEDRTPGGLGWLIGLREQWSEIPLRGAANGFESPSDEAVKTQTRRNRSGLLRLDLDGNDWGTDLSINYAPTNERYFIQNAKNSWFDLISGGPVVSVRDQRTWVNWTLFSRLGYSRLDSSRRSDTPYWKSWRWSSVHDWGNPAGTNPLSTEGSWGNVDQVQQSREFEFEFARTPFHWINGQHKVAAGIQFEHRKAFYERINDHFVYLRPTSTSSCVSSIGLLDTEGCSLAPTRLDGRGQYFAQRDTYRAGRIDAEVRSLSLWIEDDIRWKSLGVRIGARYDQDDLMDKYTLAPRTSLHWSFDNERQALIAGAGRYYGRNFFSNLLREGRESLKITQTRGANLVYGAPQVARSLNRFQELEIPYADELTAGWQWSGDGIRADLKLVHRKGRNEIIRTRARMDDPLFASNVYEYTNGGRSSSRIASIVLTGIHPLEVLGSQSEWRLSYDRTDTRRSYSDYESSLDPLDAAEPVIYRGNVIRYDELPQQNFNRPSSIRASLLTSFGASGFSISHTLLWREGFRALQVTGNEIRGGVVMDVYEEGRVSSALTLDSQIGWQAPDTWRWRPWIRVEISNLLNRRNAIGISSGRFIYELGRQYWLELGTTF